MTTAVADKLREDRNLAELRMDLEESRQRCRRLYSALVSVMGKERALAIARGELKE